MMNILRSGLLRGVTALLVMAQLGGLAILVEAKTLYVDAATGSDATTYAANDAAHPWQTIGRAARGSTTWASPNTAQAAQAGDLVLVTAGIYTETGSTAGAAARFDVALNPANSGTAGNAITFRGVGLVYVRMDGTSQGPMIGSSDKNYIVWDHFQIDDTYGGSVEDTGPVFIGNTTGVQIINSDIAGHNGSYVNGQVKFTNNYNAIRLENANNTLITNNIIHRVWGTGSAVGSGNINDACIMTYRAVSAIIEHNEFYDCGIAIEFKGASALESSQHDNIARYNWLHDNVRGIRVMLSQDTLVYQNIIVNTPDMPIGFGYDGSSTLTAATRARIVNNTLYNVTGSFNGAAYPEGTYMREPWFKNNIIHTATHAYYNYAASSPSVQTGSPQLMEIDRNLYYNVSGTFALYDQDFAPLSISFATWQGTYSLDTNGSNGTSPQFVSGTPSVAADFKLASAGQSALTMGRAVSNIGGTTGDTIPVGAYITGNEVIGLSTTTRTSGSSGASTFSGAVSIR